MALPPSYRWAVMLASIIGFQVALSSVFDAQLSLNAGQISLGGDESALASTNLPIELQHQLFVARRDGFQSAMASLGHGRVAVEALLALTAGAVFVFALRLRIASEDRAGAALLLGRVSIAAAFMRAIDGAQNLVISKTISQRLADAVGQSKLDEAAAAKAIVEGLGYLNVAWSFVVVAIFMGLAHYFRSDRLRDALLAEEP